MVKKTLFLNGSSQDRSDRFFGWPTPLLYAVSPSVQAIKDGELKLEYDPKIFEPLWYVEGKNDESIKQEFQDRIANVDIVCASAIYDSLYPTLQLLQEAKKTNPDIVTILGGPHVDEVHNLTSYSFPVDFTIAGDGEDALLAVLENAVSGTPIDPSKIHGKSWIYHKGKVVESSGGPLVLDTLPHMPIEVVDVERHRNDFDIFRDEKGDILPTFQMIGMRGCPYVCNFCSENRDLAYTNGRSIDNILEEIELRKSQGIKAIFFDDSTFGAYRSSQGNVKDLLKALGTTGMTFWSLNRFNHLKSPEVVQVYVDAGFTYVYCAIEQFDDPALRSMTKGQRTSDIELAMQQLHNHGLKVGVSLLYGLPYETIDSIRATLDFTGKWTDNGTIVLVSESVLSYHPGTPAGRGSYLDFNRTPPHIGYPYDQFEEGQWYHPEHVTPQYLEKILKMSEDRFGRVMVRHRHSWHADQGHLLP